MEVMSGKPETGEPWRPGAYEPRGDLLGSARERFEALGDCVADAVATARQKMADLCDDGFEKMKSDVIGYAKEQPTSALVLAAGIGVLVGILLGLRRR